MLKRSPLSRQDGKARLAVPVKRKCKACRQPFAKASAWQTHCRAEECAVAATVAARAKRERAEAKAHRLALADSKPLAHWLHLTERVVNHYILVRDMGLPCISCGTRQTVLWQAGHYLSVGARPEIRYRPANINRQCLRCNVELSGNQAKYRIGLVEKIGLVEVERLEGPHPPAKFTREALAAIRKEFAAMTRQLEKTQ